MAAYTQFYQLAHYYDIALRRDVTAQIDFICDVYAHQTGRPLMSLLEIACGPGYHVAAAAKRGLKAYGLDLMPPMIDYAQQLHPELSVTWIAADMRDFWLPQPVDMAINIFDGIDALLDDEDVLHHLRCVASNLVEGGLYLIQTTHPRESNLAVYGDYSYHGERDGVRVDIAWAVNGPQFDLLTGVADVEIELHIDDKGDVQTIHDRARERVFSPPELRLLANASGVFDIVGWYGDFRIDQPLDHSPEAQVMILILKQKG